MGNFEWILMALSIGGFILNTKRRVEGYYLWGLTNIGWIYIDWSVGLYGQSALFTVYLLLTFYGIWEWRQDRVKSWT